MEIERFEKKDVSDALSNFLQIIDQGLRNNAVLNICISNEI
jgi:hypothetical protein